MRSYKESPRTTPGKKALRKGAVARKACAKKAKACAKRAASSGRYMVTDRDPPPNPRPPKKARI